MGITWQVVFANRVVTLSYFSKAVTMFEDDERYKAVEREKDRKDFFENYIDELRQKVCFGPLTLIYFGWCVSKMYITLSFSCQN